VPCREKSRATRSAQEEFIKFCLFQFFVFYNTVKSGAIYSTPFLEKLQNVRSNFLISGTSRRKSATQHMNAQPQPGSKAPAFSAHAVGGFYEEPAMVHLAKLKGETVVLYFYPKDDTPGCTKQACALRDGWREISAKAKVFGVSIDPIKSHEKFIKKHSLPFPIISDEDHKIVNAYGVWVEKSMYGKTYMGTERTTFIIGPNGKIKAVLPKVKPEEHLARVLELL
jgi:peroxiredoxin Q/BCP